MKDINLKGGDAPGFCRFKAFELSYRCEYAVDEYSGARFNVDPTPKYPENQNFFILKDEINFDIEIAHKAIREPTDSSNNNKIFVK